MNCLETGSSRQFVVHHSTQLQPQYLKLVLNGKPTQRLVFRPQPKSRVDGSTVRKRVRFSLDGVFSSRQLYSVRDSLGVDYNEAPNQRFSSLYEVREFGEPGDFKFLLKMDKKMSKELNCPAYDKLWLRKICKRQAEKKVYKNYHAYVVATKTRGNLPVAVLILKEERKGPYWMELFFISVDESHQGKSIGTELMKFSERLTRDKFSHCSSIRLHVVSSNCKAYACYRKYGFRTTNYKRNYPMENVNSFRMVKDFASGVPERDCDENSEASDVASQDSIRTVSQVDLISYDASVTDTSTNFSDQENVNSDNSDKLPPNTAALVSRVQKLQVRGQKSSIGVSGSGVLSPKNGVSTPKKSFKTTKPLSLPSGALRKNTKPSVTSVVNLVEKCTSPVVSTVSSVPVNTDGSKQQEASSADNAKLSSAPNTLAQSARPNTPFRAPTIISLLESPEKKRVDNKRVIDLDECDQQGPKRQKLEVVEDCKKRTQSFLNFLGSSSEMQLLTLNAQKKQKTNQTNVFGSAPRRRKEKSNSRLGNSSTTNNELVPQSRDVSGFVPVTASTSNGFVPVTAPTSNGFVAVTAPTSNGFVPVTAPTSNGFTPVTAPTSHGFTPVTPPASRRISPLPFVPQPRVPQPRVPQPCIPQPRIPQPRIPQPRIPQPRIPQPRIPQPRVPQRVSPTQVPSTPVFSLPEGYHQFVAQQQYRGPRVFTPLQIIRDGQRAGVQEVRTVSPSQLNYMTPQHVGQFETVVAPVAQRVTYVPAQISLTPVSLSEPTTKHVIY